jgi:hypothetical protein
LPPVVATIPRDGVADFREISPRDAFSGERERVSEPGKNF